ncbi:MAG: LuxR C-terminal-related transcriptional regulator [Coriobacteriales bacterium]|jgi:DNA-binding CsgD family transcriptional regulator|nr:LuxR C-terminal-related transcriptional regulator [Coriobacteriales bacterium]
MPRRSFAQLAVNVRASMAGVTWHDFCNVRSIGFTLIRGWGLVIFFGGFVLITQREGLPALEMAVSTAATIITLLFSAIFSKVVDRAFGLPAFKVAVLAACPLGALIALGGAGFSDTYYLIAALSGEVLFGAGSTFVLIGYGKAHSYCQPNRMSVEVPFAIVLGATLMLLVLSAQPVVIQLACSLLPSIAGIILFSNSFTWNPGSAEEHRSSLQFGPFIRRFGVCSCLAGIADCLVRTVFFDSALYAATVVWYENPVFLSCLIMAAIIYPCILLTGNNSVQITYRSIVFAMAALFMLLPALSEYLVVVNVLALAAYETFIVFVWILLATIASRLKLAPTMVFGLGLSLLYIGHFLGGQIAPLLAVFKPYTPQFTSLIVLIAAACILSSYMFIFNERSLAELIKGEDSDRSRQPFKEHCETIASEYSLSPRETEVMILFAKGHSITRIQSDLYISRGTASTHLRHIYKKLNVHDKQEFLDFVDIGKPADPR